MIQRVRRSFPAKLLIAGLLVLVVVGGYASLTAAQTTEDVRAEQTEELTTDAQQAAATTAVWLDGVEAQGQAVATRVTETDGSEAAIQSTIDTYAAGQQLEEGVVAIGYYDGDTYVGATESAMAETSPAAEDAPWVDAVGNETRLSTAYNVSWRDHPVVAMTVPVEDGGQVVVLLDLHEFSETIGPNHENVVIANGDRTILGHHNTSKIGTKHRSVGGTISSLAAGEGNATTKVMGDRGMVMSFAPVEGAGWTLMVHESTESAFGIAGQVQSGLAGVLFIGLVGLVVIGATVGSTTVITIRQLSRRAEEMAAGNLDVSVESKRVDEFGRLQDSLATMRDNLKERIDEAERAKENAESAREEAEQARQEAEREREEAEAFNERLRETAEEYAAVMQAAANGDLTRRIDTEDRPDVMAAVGEEFNSMLAEIEETTAALVQFAENVAETADGVEQRADEVQTASEQVAASIDDIQTGASEQDENLNDVAREVENLSASAEEIAATTDDVAKTSERTAQAAEAGEEAATEALDEMDGVVETTADAAEAIQALDEEMAQIGEIVDVIQDIAEETNMLALNASIEAARAGDGDNGGQGFAVVADEVKGLSEETKESADEIEQRITSVQSQTGDAVETVTTAREKVQDTAETVEQALQELETIAERVEENDQSIQEINEVTTDQAESAQGASKEIDEVAEISQETVEQATQVSSAAQQQTAAVDEVRTEVSDLSQQAESLQRLLEQFTVNDGSSAGIDAGAGANRPASADGGTGGDD